MIRHEDLSSPDDATRRATMRKILDTLDIGHDDDLDWLDVSEWVNATPATSEYAGPDDADVEQICGELLGTFGYRRSANAGTQ